MHRHTHTKRMKSMIQVAHTIIKYGIMVQNTKTMIAGVNAEDGGVDDEIINVGR